MTKEELSWEEKNHLYKLCLIPTFAVFFIVLVYFNYLMYTDPMKTLWDFIIRVGWLYIFMPITFFITFEVLSYRKMKSPTFHLKRLVGRILLLLLGAFSFFGFLFATQMVFSPIIGNWEGSVVGSVLWVILFTLVVMKLKNFFKKLDKGDW